MKTYICTNCKSRSCVVASEGSNKPNGCPHNCAETDWHQAGKTSEKENADK